MSVSLKTNDFFEGFILDNLNDYLKENLPFDPRIINRQSSSTIRYNESDRDGVKTDILEFFHKDHEVIYELMSSNGTVKEKIKIILKDAKGNIIFVTITLDASDAMISILYNEDLKFDEKIKSFISEHEELEDEEEEGLQINYLYNRDHSANLHKKRINVDDLDELKINYLDTSFKALIALRDMLQVGVEESKIAYIGGCSGVGKTYALQGLMSSLVEKYEIVVVYDACSFLSDLSLYEEITTEYLQKPCIFIFDDVSFRDLNQYKSTLTSLIGGLFSASRKDIFIFSSDDEIKYLDKSLLRPGRCIAQIEISHLSQQEVEAWLIANEVINRPKKIRGNLADLYALKEGIQITERSKSLLC